MLCLREKLDQLFAGDQVDAGELQNLLNEFKSNKSEWQKYAIFNENTYTRNLVDSGNGKYNLMILCWGPGMGSRIHDHSNSHCFVKVLDGQLKETRFDQPVADGPQLPTGTNLYNLNDVSYMADDLGLHRMENPSNSNGTVSLHLYAPPFDRCNTFCERTGTKSQCMVTFHNRPDQVDHRNLASVPESPAKTRYLDNSCSEQAIDEHCQKVIRAA